jgi:hypothetical protein
MTMYIWMLLIHHEARWCEKSMIVLDIARVVIISFIPKARNESLEIEDEYIR